MHLYRRFMVKPHTSDIRMTYGYIRVTYGWYTSTYQLHRDDIRVHTSGIWMTYEWHTDDIRVNTGDIWKQDLSNLFSWIISFHLALLFLLTPPEAGTGVVLYKKLLLKILQYSQENTCVGVSFIKRRVQHRCFPVNIAKCLRTPILKNSYEWRLLRLILRSHLRVST